METKKGNLADLLDMIISSGLETDVDTYNDIINNYCSYWEARYIISVFISYREDKFERARNIFNHHLKKRLDNVD
jgi:hypothetical protein